MGVGKSTNFEPTVLDKYATTRYFLSKGSSGNVYGPIKLRGSKLAIKQSLFADGNATDDNKRRIGLEEKKDIWTLLEHKNLMKIHWVDLTRLPKVMFIVMDFAGGGSLHKTLSSLGSENKLPIDVVTDWAKQIADGMLYLHNKDIVHRDLKSSNILLMEPFDIRISQTKMTLKIADFDEIKEHDQTATMTTFFGTCAYMAPEVIQNQRFSKASDVWSFGVVIWGMLSGKIPHNGLDQRTLMSKSISGNLDNLSMEQSFPEELKRLLNRCWESTHEKRISFGGISIVLHGIDVKRRRQDEIELQRREEEEQQKLRGLIATIRSKAAEEMQKPIRGLTILDNELFVVSDKSSEVEVYDSTNFSFSRQWNLKELINPYDIVSCHINKCLYINDFKVIDLSSEIFRVGLNGKLIKKIWSTEMDCGRLSVSYDSNVILAAYDENKLNEFSPDGQLIREIHLSSDEGFSHPLHAIKLTNGHFVVSHGDDVDDDDDDDLHRVCIVDADGKLLKSFGGKRGSSISQTHCPMHLSVDGNGSVLVADFNNRRVLLLDSNLEFKKEILTKEHGLRYPKRILLDESNRRLFVSTNEKNNYRILIFDLGLLRQTRNVTLNS